MRLFRCALVSKRTCGLSGFSKNYMKVERDKMINFEEEQAINVKEIKELVNDYPFKTKEIKEFFTRHSGNSPNDFIPYNFQNRCYFNGIFAILRFLDRYGSIDIYIDINKVTRLEAVEGAKNHKTSLCSQILSVAENIIKPLKKKPYQLEKMTFPNIRMLEAGIAALAQNIGLGLGCEFLNCFNGDVYHASMAVLERMPDIRNLHSFKDLSEILRLNYIHANSHRAYDYISTKKRDSISVDIARLLLDADLKAKREKIYELASQSETLDIIEISNKSEVVQNEIASDRSALERQQYFDKLDAEFQRKKASYKTEMAGLKSSRDKLEAERNLMAIIIKAQDRNDPASVKEAKDELKKFRRALHLG